MYADCQAQLLINISKHFAGGYMPTAEWEAKMLSEMGALTRESVEIIAANTGQAPEAIRKAITEGMGLEIAETEKVLKGAAKAGKIQGAKESWQASPRVQGVVGSLTAQAKEDFNVVNTVMLESTRNRYAASIQYCRGEEQKLIEKLMSASNAQELDNQLATAQRALNASTASVAIGAEARTQAVRRTIKQLADQGITGYIDAGGHHWSPEAYINMDVRTTVHNAAIQGQQARSADYGVTTFQISTHAGARPLCEPYQGKFYSWDGTSGTVEDLSGKRYTYESIYETSYGEAAGIFGINCGHSPQTFVDGFSVPRYEPTQDEAKNAEEYALSQRQRYMEREIRQSKTEALCYDAAGDKEAFEKTAAKIKQQNANYKAFCSENGRTPRMDRTQVYGYNRSVSGKATQAAKNAEIKPFMPPKPQQEYSETAKALLNVLGQSGIAENPAKKLSSKLTTDQIIDKIGGGDRTKGSCASVAFSYIGNKGGYDMRDFRGGESCSFFSRNGNIDAICSLADSATVIKEYNDFKAAHKLLDMVENGKEYYFGVGKHVAIIRGTETGAEYLELQSISSNGFKELTDDVLKNRFGCKRSHTIYGTKMQISAELVEVDALKNNNEFIEIMKYVNTAKGEQLKGVGGGTK